MKFYNRIWRTTIGLMLFSSIAACSGGASHSTTADHSTFNPKPMDPTTIESQLSRYHGQTSFVSAIRSYGQPGIPKRSAGSDAASESGQRDIQESDIFKVGKEGSKLLYLLNNYRGLQVVSFEDGADKPKLVGRVAPTGNFPDTMYYDEKNDRLIVLERNWNDPDGDYNLRDSRMLVYDVAIATAPKITHKLRIAGEVSDSRLVGDILYVATAIWPSYNDRSGQAAGYVTSYNLAGETPTVVESFKLALPVDRRENMNIVSTKKGDEYQYYLVASLTQNRWGWRNRQSTIEVVDISDAKGLVKPIMQVSAKGLVRERTSTFIKNDTLIVTSNYFSTNRIMRVAVETFTFPKKSEGPKLISAEEAEYRRLHMERELSRAAPGTDLDKLRDELLSDDKLGLKGVFVSSQDESPKKLFPDSDVTTGDTTGLSSDLRDIRYHGDYLYVFWVPSNMSDPLDIFDISSPEKGITYLKRELFEGWIERAIPVTYKDREFILGLGYIVPAVDNERGRRLPQAMLFEVMKRGERVVIDTVAQIDLELSNVWVNFNSPDRYIETKFNDDGTGVIMFQISSWGSKPISGGKFIGFDLENAASGDGTEVFTEGGLLKASAGWLRRVFTNTEIDRINTFSDQALGVFGVNGRHAGTADQTIEAIATLELARNVKSYLTLGNADAGILIVGEGYDYQGDAKTSIRLLADNVADTDKPAVTVLELHGSYLTHLKDSRDSVLVATRRRVRTEPQDDADRDVYYPSWISEVVVTRVKLASNSFEQSGEVIIKEPEQQRDWHASPVGRGVWRPYYRQPLSIVQSATKNLYTAYGNSVYKLSNAPAELASTEAKLAGNCGPEKKQNLTFGTIGSQFYLTFDLPVVEENPKYEDIAFVKNYATLVSDNGESLSCSGAINVPGSNVLLAKPGHIVTMDQRVLDLAPKTYEYKDEEGNVATKTYHDIISTPVAMSLEVKSRSNNIAKLKDMYDIEGHGLKMHSVDNQSLAFVETPQDLYNRVMFSTLDFTTGKHFEKTTHLIGEKRYNQYSRVMLAGVFPDTLGGYYGVIVNNRKAEVIRWTADGARPEIMSISLVDSFGVTSEPTTSFNLINYGSLYYGDQDSKPIHFDEKTGTFVLSQGLYGASQVVVIK